eukprot:Hpha_TRINITY_DN16391_c0_g1::TRINITY_DN16391_c0_g1_i4::g.61158::m.61158
MALANSSLEKLIPRSGGLPMDKALRIAEEVCGGLAYLHSRQPPWVHCDIKPANIVLDDIDSIPLITDFGVARKMRGPCSIYVGSMRGTVIYCAPENLDAKNPHNGAPPSDIYSVGCLLSEMISGNAPWKDADPLDVMRRKDRGEQPEVPFAGPEVQDLIRQCWDLPSGRPTAETLKAKLAELRSK